MGPGSTCVHPPDKEESTLEERQAQAATEKPGSVFPMRAIHPVTNTTPYLNELDKNRSSLELEKQWDGEAQNYQLKYFSPVKMTP